MAVTGPSAVDFEVKERAMDEAPIGITISDPDRADNPLVYVNDAFERLTGYPRDEVLGRNCRFLQGEETDPAAVTRLREAIDAAEAVTVELQNYRRSGEPFWNEVTVAPLRDEDGTVTNFVGFQVDVTQRKEAELALAAERERLDRVLDRIEGVLADVTELLMHGVDRAETEQAIVDRLAATDTYAAAWIGEHDLARNVLVTSTAAGFETSPRSLTFDLDEDAPAARAYAAGRAGLADLEAEGPFAHPRASRLAAVPLAYGDATYGVLVVLGDETLDERELVVLESVGRTIATAINAAQSRRGLTAEDSVELEFSVADPAFFPVALADAWDCRVEHRGATRTDEGRLRMFVDVSGNPQSLPTPPSIEGVEAIDRIGEAETSLVGITLAPGSVVDRLAERGAALRSLTAEAGVAELAVAIPAETGGRVALDVLETRLEGVELRAYRERDRSPTTRSGFLADLESRLTPRQASALRSAYYSGYYDDPRQTGGDELADAMGVSRATFHQHLRAAERKLLAALLE